MAWTVFRQHASLLSKLLADGTGGNEDLEVTLKGVLCDLDETEGTTALRAALCLLNDLARQRWSIRVTVAGVVEVKRPTGDQLDPLQEKARIRAQELIKRNEQLREPATRKFIKGMERKSVCLVRRICG